MKIEGAIETLTIWKPESCLPPLADELNALKLGIEALKQVKDVRLCGRVNVSSLLPGETEE